MLGGPRRDVIQDLPRDELEDAHDVPLLLRVPGTWDHVLHALEGPALVFNRLLLVKDFVVQSYFWDQSCCKIMIFAQKIEINSLILMLP